MQSNWHIEAIALYIGGLSYQQVAARFGKSFYATYHAINMSRTAHGGRPAIEQGPNAAFTPEQVRLIRQRIKDGESHAHLAHEYGVTRRTIRNIETYKNYRYVE